MSTHGGPARSAPSGTGTGKVPPQPTAAADGAGGGAAPRTRSRWARAGDRLHLTLPGCWGALVLACLSFTPSLLPRGGFLQGVVCGIDAAIGYGLGVLGAAIWRTFPDRPARPARRRSWQVFAIAGAVLLPLSFALGQYWQSEIRRLMGVDSYSVLGAVLSPFVAAGVFLLVLLVGRGLRRLYRWLSRLLGRWIGPRAAAATGWLLVATLSVLLVTGVLLDGAVALANQMFSVRNTTTVSGERPPTSPLRSGGPGSLVPWSTLGRQGRSFVANGPTPEDIGSLTGRAAQEPVRAYAGLDSAGDVEARAALAVDDLARAGGFHRRNLLVFTTTGSGWVDPAAVDSFEYLTGGDSATVAMQYSYLPSWLSYLVDQTKARAAGRQLFDAVYARWSQLPEQSRPRLFVAGESLGSFGAETAFSGEYDLRNRTAGTLFAGPPNFNTLFREFSDQRDPGSPEVQPVYKDGRTVRFADDAGSAIPPQGQPWNGTRVLYLMHPSDPIVWWTPRLLLHRQAWVGEQPGRDVLDQVVWMPFVTFWQVSADLPFATGVPAGHGHSYSGEYVDGWSAVLRPQGFSAAQLAELHRRIAAVH